MFKIGRGGRTLLLIATLGMALTGCGGGKSEKEKDRLDEESLKALKNPPPGAPGAPPSSDKQVPNAPTQGGSSTGN